MIRLWIPCVAAMLLLACGPRADRARSPAKPPAATISFATRGYQVDVLADGKPVTTFHYDPKWDKPFLYPLRTASGRIISRGYAVEPREGEHEDHAWHRGIWYGHGDINGEDFWREKGRETTGMIVLTSEPHYVTAEGSGTLKLDLGLQAPKKTLLGSLHQHYAFSQSGSNVIIETALSIRADQGVALTMGDTEDGGFAFRLADAFRQDQGALLINSDGLQDTENIWGKRARWIDYSAILDGTKASVAVFDHPSNLRYPSGWHARGYGLASANPFAARSFSVNKARDGSYTIPEGEAVNLRYRAVIHEGDLTVDDIEKLFRDFASSRTAP